MTPSAARNGRRAVGVADRAGADALVVYRRLLARGLRWFDVRLDRQRCDRPSVASASAPADRRRVALDRGCCSAAFAALPVRADRRRRALLGRRPLGRHVAAGRPDARLLDRGLRRARACSARFSTSLITGICDHASSCSLPDRARGLLGARRNPRIRAAARDLRRSSRSPCRSWSSASRCSSSAASSCRGSRARTRCSCWCTSRSASRSSTGRSTRRWPPPSVRTPERGRRHVRRDRVPDDRPRGPAEHQARSGHGGDARLRAGDRRVRAGQGARRHRSTTISDLERRRDAGDAAAHSGRWPS